MQPIRPSHIFAMALLGLTSWQASAQDFPNKAITLVVPFSAGSATDQLARVLAQSLGEQTQQSVVIDNKPGASGFLGAQQVARATPDGYTLLIATNTTHAANEHLFKKLPYDPIKDFAPLTALGKGSQIMVVNPKLAATTAAEFITLAQQKQGKLTFGSGSSSSRIAGELFMQMAGVQLLHVPYKSNPLAVTDLLGGQIDMMITDNATGIPHLASGKLRALGTSGSTRSSLTPDVPTIGETVKGYEMGYWFAAYAPAGTPKAVVDKLNQWLLQATQSSAASAFYQSTGTQIYTTSPAELAQFQQAESEKWGRIIKAAGIDPS